jgi:hypothetical protein
MITLKLLTIVLLLDSFQLWKNESADSILNRLKQLRVIDAGRLGSARTERSLTTGNTAAAELAVFADRQERFVRVATT